MDIEYWMRQAILLACDAASKKEVPVGALLIHEGEILATGQNRREEEQRTIAHAEIVALEEYNERYKSWRFPPRTSLVVTAEPCLMCVGALLWARLDEIYYGCPDSKNAGLRRVLPLIEEGIYDHTFANVTGEILLEECGELLCNFFSVLRNKENESSK